MSGGNGRASSSSSSSSRTKIRDPRNRIAAAKERGIVVDRTSSSPAPVATSSSRRPNEVGPPLLPSLNRPSDDDNRSSLGLLGSYALAGVGVALGATLVGALFGAIG
ncbi:hypothetical protein ACHAW5_006430 [Stephanodiscus triporus]|uniref:Uncharacterized protein n=1 Tax=Stephanodiscus triporus TaxID=2934178 RepID=A0ABD3NCR3_9STRA